MENISIQTKNTINEWGQLVAYISTLRRQNYGNKSYLAKAKSTDLSLRNLIMLIRTRDLSHKVISYNSLICIYIIMCVIIHLLQSLSRIIYTHTKAIRFDSIRFAFPWPFIFNQMLFVCFTSRNLFGCIFIESNQLIRIESEWMQMFNTNRTNHTPTHTHTKCANRAMKMGKSSAHEKHFGRWNWRINNWHTFQTIGNADEMQSPSYSHFDCYILGG